MAKYSYEVTLKTGEIKLVVPEKLATGNLADFDRFIEGIGGTIKFEQYISDKLGISCFDIKGIKILGNTKQIHFALMNGDQYLAPVLNDLKVKAISIPGRYSKTTTTVSTENPAYKEMKKYLYDNIRGDYNYFLSQVYTLNNQFSRLLNSYGYSYQQRMCTSEEDDRNIADLETQINQELSVYKNYRGLCRYRTLAETKMDKHIKKGPINNLTIKPDVKVLTPYTFDKDEEVAKQTVSYNQEYDEFLEPDEYEKMLGDSYNKL